MVVQSWNMKKNEIASGLEDDEDCAWAWTVRYWELLAHGPVSLEGLLIETSSLEGLLEETTSLEGVLEEEESLEGVN